MERYELSSWADDYKENAEKIHSISCQIQSATERIIRCDITQDQAVTLLNNILVVLEHWTGSTYIGNTKEKELKKAYQAFFNALYKLVLKCKEIDNSVLQECADNILYQGQIFRYLGHSSPHNCNISVDPIYDDIYVSWSKEPKNSYVESKLYGTMTWISAEINEPYYGIDLEGVEKAITLLTNEECSVSKGNEREVVFPTIKECIMEVKYIEDDFEDQEDEQA